MRHLARRAGVSDLVQHLGYIDDADLAALYSRSVLLAVSSREGLGLPPLEAVMSGGRVVAVPLPVYRASLAGAATFAAGEDAESIADAVEAAAQLAGIPDR